MNCLVVLLEEKKNYCQKNVIILLALSTYTVYIVQSENKTYRKGLYAVFQFSTQKEVFVL